MSDILKYLDGCEDTVKVSAREGGQVETTDDLNEFLGVVGSNPPELRKCQRVLDTGIKFECDYLLDQDGAWTCEHCQQKVRMCDQSDCESDGCDWPCYASVCLHLKHREG